MAEQKGYFDEHVPRRRPEASFSTANYPLVAADEAQFSSAGSFTEVAHFAAANDAELVVVVDRRASTAIDALIVKPDEVTTLADLDRARRSA